MYSLEFVQPLEVQKMLSIGTQTDRLYSHLPCLLLTCSGHPRRLPRPYIEGLRDYWREAPNRKVATLLEITQAFSRTPQAQQLIQAVIQRWEQEIVQVEYHSAAAIEALLNFSRHSTLEWEELGCLRVARTPRPGGGRPLTYIPGAELGRICTWEIPWQ